MNVTTTASVPTPQGGRPPIREDIPARGFDLDRSRRPGTPRLHAPEPLPNAHHPPERQRNRPSVPKHGRPGKPFPPVFGTAVPLSGLAGMVRRAAYRSPDHVMRHWTMLLLADRVDVWEHRVRAVARVATPAAALALFAFAFRALGRR